MQYIGLVVGFILLVKCADWFVDGSSNLAAAMGVRTLVIGLTVVSFGTSAPEAAVSISASLVGQNDIAVGNAMGSNICNLLLVLGASAVFYPLKADKKVLLKDYMFSILAALVLIFVTADVFLADGVGALLHRIREGETESGPVSYITRSEGLVMLAFIIAYVYSLVLGVLDRETAVAERQTFRWRYLLLIAVGITGIMVGGDLVVDSSVKIAASFGVSTQLVALTIVAVGTSLPELVTSVVAARKHETDIALGNAIGSNLFNIFFILGSAAAVSPLRLTVLAFTDILVMTVLLLVVLMLAWRGSVISRGNGIFMLLLYAAYLFYVVMR